MLEAIYSRAGNPDWARWVDLPRSGSQLEQRIRFLFPTSAASERACSPFPPFATFPPFPHLKREKKKKTLTREYFW